MIGETKIRELVAAFYRRIPQDPLLGPMYPSHDLAGAEARLAGFLVQRFGGDNAYSRQRGHPRLRMRHAPFRVDLAARDRWLQLMGSAMDEVGFDARVRREVSAFFDEVAQFLVNS
jgi:hemoglobin